MSLSEINALETKIGELTAELRALQAKAPGQVVPDYEFQTLEGGVRLSELFAGHDTLLVIHNMGKGCRYCTLWADGINAFVAHLESAVGLVLVSKDTPGDQRLMANSRGWRMRMASHGGGKYMSEQASDNMPGVVCYKREGGEVVRKAAAAFGPGDLYCALWNFLGLAGIGLEEFTPQFNYWKRPEQLIDGGQNLLD